MDVPLIPDGAPNGGVVMDLLRNEQGCPDVSERKLPWSP